MLAIKSIEVVQVDRDRIEVAASQSINDVRVFDVNNKPSMMDVSQAFEVIEGRRFVNTRGQEFCVGMSKQAQEAIGLPFEAFENMDVELDSCRVDIINLKRINEDQQEEIEKMKNANFIKRLSYAFFGKMK